MTATLAELFDQSATLAKLLAKLFDQEQVIYADFEFIAKPGEPPDVVCLAWREEPSGQTYQLWRDQLGATPPYRTDNRALFVCFVGNAELHCHLALGWPLPANVLDLSAEFRRVTNGRTVPAGKGLLGALAYYGFNETDCKRKEAMRKRIMQGWPFTAEEREEILRYCASDIDALYLLLARMLAEIELPNALHRASLLPPCAYGVPRRADRHGDISAARRCSMPGAMCATRWCRLIDADYGVYVKGLDGDWHFNLEHFGKYLARAGITGWPITEQGKLSLKRKTFEDMAKGHPQLEGLRQLRHARDKMRKIKLAVGADGRNRTVLWPYKAKTSRTQPKASQWIFSPAVWLRSLIKPAPGMALAYVDWSSMEFLIAAGLSNDPVMLEFYRVGTRISRLPSGSERLRARPPSRATSHPRPLQDRTAGDPVRNTGRDLGARGSASHVRRPRDDQPASRAIRGVLALVGRLAGACAQYRSDVDSDGLDVSHRHYRVQRPLHRQFSSTGLRRRHSADRLHLGQ